MLHVCREDRVHARPLSPAGVQTLIHKCMAAPIQTFTQSLLATNVLLPVSSVTAPEKGIFYTFVFL